MAHGNGCGKASCVVKVGLRSAVGDARGILLLPSYDTSGRMQVIGHVAAQNALRNATSKRSGKARFCAAVGNIRHPINSGRRRFKGHHLIEH